MWWLREEDSLGSTESVVGNFDRSPVSAEVQSGAQESLLQGSRIRLQRRIQAQKVSHETSNIYSRPSVHASLAIRWK